MFWIVCVVVLCIILSSLTECTHCVPMLFSAASRGNITSSFEWKEKKKEGSDKGGQHMNIMKQEQKDLITSQPNTGPNKCKHIYPLPNGHFHLKRARERKMLLLQWNCKENVKFTINFWGFIKTYNELYTYNETNIELVVQCHHCTLGK